MNEKDYNLIYEKNYNKYLEKYIKEIEYLYKISKKEGDAENFAYNTCLSTLAKKKNGLKVFTHPYDKLYSKFNNRGSLVQENNMNRLCINHIIPLGKELKISLNASAFDKILEEFAIMEASKRVSSWFCNWSPVYELMFKLNDFSEFEIIRNCNSHERSELFNKYHKKLYPENYENENIQLEIEKRKYWKDINNFGLKKEYQSKIEDVFNFCIKKAIIDVKAPYNSFEDIFTKNWDSHKLNLRFNNNQEFSLLVSKIRFVFENFNDVAIGSSKLFKSGKGIPISRDNLVSSRKVFKDSDKLSLEEIPKKLNDKQIEAIYNVNEIIKILKSTTQKK